MTTYSEEVFIEGQVKLGVTVTKPTSTEKESPAVVIIGGTGSLNRDGNGLGFTMNLYRDMAESLSTLGFVTARYDKRGVGKSEGDRYKSGVTELVEDVKSVVSFLKKQSYVDPDRILLVGHSEGCILATLVAEEISVAGMILLSGAGVSLKTSMEEQARFLLDEVQETRGIKGKLLRLTINEKSVVQKQQNLFKRVTGTKEDAIRIQLMKFPAKWLREHLSYTDADLQARLDQAAVPILAVTGDKDVQTDYRNLRALETLGENHITVRTIPDMDHMLKQFSGKMSVLDVKKQYRQEIAQPLHPELTETIRDWTSQSGFLAR